MQAVEVKVRSIIAESLQIINSTEEQITESNQILTKQDRNIWDEEW